MNIDFESSRRRREISPAKNIPIIVVMLGAMLAAGMHAADPDPRQKNLGDLSIEELMNEPVTSVSKRETNLFQSPAAIAVVTADDISRLNFTSLPEALRFVPGLDVARINGSSWAVAARGGNSQFSNDTLVLIDGRTIYSSSFGGVYWKTQGVPMQDIDRIEVIRGPGAILWGANAFNGVVNVISKSAEETQGLQTTVSEGTEDNPSATVRYGAKAGESVYYRAYVSHFDRNGFSDPAGGEAGDFSRGWRTGFRLDAAPSAQDSITVEGNGYDIRTGESARIARLDLAGSQLVHLVSGDRGGDLLGRWVRRNSETNQWSVQTFYDHYHNSVAYTQEINDTLDLEFQDRFSVGRRHDIVAGFGYRYVRGVLPPSATATWTPELNLIHLYTAFVQDQVNVIPDRLSVVWGTKFEHNDTTGFEIEPGLRLLWTPMTTQTVWLSATRAVRTPALTETAAQFTVSAFPSSPGGPPAAVVLAGNPAIDRSEKVEAYEAGYRIQPAPNLSFDATIFYNRYSDFINYGPAVGTFVLAPAPPHLRLLSTAETDGSGHSYGGEVAVQWRPTNRWRLAADYSLLRSRFFPDDSETENNPRHQFHLRSYLELPRHFELNGALAYVSHIVDTATSVPLPVPSYVRIDLGLVWRPSSQVEIGIWGRNLSDRRHLEFGSQITPVLSEAPREIAVRIIWRH